MNKIFQTVWNESKQTWTTVSEISRSGGSHRFIIGAILISSILLGGLGGASPAFAEEVIIEAAPIVETPVAPDPTPEIPSTPPPPEPVVEALSAPETPTTPDAPSTPEPVVETPTTPAPTTDPVVEPPAISDSPKSIETPTTTTSIDPGTLPTGGTILAGDGSISSYGKSMTVNQTSDRMIADWSTFNIGEDASVRFNQPGSDSAALNRIHDSNPSQILGSLSANGQIYLINPSGIVFGKTAQVDVGGLIASASGMSDEDFMNGGSSTLDSEENEKEDIEDDETSGTSPRNS